MTERKNSIFPRECRTCKVEKGEADFSSYPYKGQRYHRSACRACSSIYDSKRVRQYIPYANKSEEDRQKSRDASHRVRERYRKEKLCFGCQRPLTEKVAFCADCKPKRNKDASAQNLALKLEVFTALGGQKCACPCGCKITAHEILTIDHIDGWRKHHDKKLVGVALYRWLRRNNYPAGFRVLCMNCNFSHGHFGYCPHELQTADITYPGQTYFHQHNLDIARAETNWRASRVQ